MCNRTKFVKIQNLCRLYIDYNYRCTTAKNNNFKKHKLHELLHFSLVTNMVSIHNI